MILTCSHAIDIRKQGSETLIQTYYVMSHTRVWVCIAFLLPIADILIRSIMIAVWEALHIENKHPDVLLLWCTCNASFFCWCDGFFCYWTAFFNTQCAFNRLYTLQISQFLVLFMNAKVANCVLVQFIYLIYCCASCCNHSKSAVIWILFSIMKTMYESNGCRVLPWRSLSLLVYC